MNDLWLVGVAGIHSVQAKAGPYRRQAAEMLMPGKPVAALDALCVRGGEQNRDIVAALRMAGREDLARRCLPQDPFQRGISATPEISGNAEPVKMHVYGQGSGRGMIRQPALLPANLRQGHARAAEFRGQRQQEIFRRPEILEIFVDEAVLPVVGGGARGKSRQHLFGKHRFHRPRRGGRMIRVAIAARGLSRNSCVRS